MIIILVSLVSNHVKYLKRIYDSYSYNFNLVLEVLIFWVCNLLVTLM